MSPSRSADEASPDYPPRTSPIPPSRVSPLFQAPATPEPRSSSPSPQDSPAPSPSPSDAVAAPSWSTDAPDDPIGLSAAEPSDTPSTGKGFNVSKAGLKAGVGAGFRQLCKLVGAFVGTQLEREYDVWKPDAEDVEDVARPATSIIYRRLPDDAKSGDVIDLLAVAFAVVGYLGKSMARRAELRAVLAHQEAQGINVHEQGAQG